MDPHLDRAYPEKLSEWGLFKNTRPRLELAAGVVFYDLNTPLFSNGAGKYRTVWMPAGTAAEYRPSGVLSFPVGTIITKTFSFPRTGGGEQFIETRLLVRQRGGWITLPYIWNRDQTEALLDPTPPPTTVRWTDEGGAIHAVDYPLPNVNQCAACHDQGAPLGPTAANLNHGDQLARWVRAGYLKGAPDAASAPRLAVWNDPHTGSVRDRARAYLDVNCASCHRPETRAAKSGPLLRLTDPDPTALQTRAIIDRMETLDPEKGMPNIAHTVVHREGVQLVRQWAESAAQ